MKQYLMIILIAFYLFSSSAYATKEVLKSDMKNIENEVLEAANNIKQNNFGHQCNDKGCPCRFNK